MEMNVETGMFSLADLAAMATDDIATLMSRLPDEGIFVVRGTEVKASQTEGKEDQPPMFAVSFQYEVLAAKPLDKNKDPESYIGRVLRERYTLWPKDFTEMVGLLKGRYQTVELPNAGNFGAVEGAEPGWVDGVVGHVFQLRIRHWTGRNGQNNASFDWQKYEGEGAEEAA